MLDKQYVAQNPVKGGKTMFAEQIRRQRFQMGCTQPNSACNISREHGVKCYNCKRLTESANMGTKM